MAARDSRRFMISRLYWRVVLGILLSEPILGAVANLLRALQPWLRPHRVERLLTALIKSRLFPARRLACDQMEGDWYLAFTGMAEQYFKIRVQWHMAGVRLQRRTPTRPAAPRSPLRVGVLAKFSGTLSFGVNLFENHPPDIEVHAFDIPFGGSPLYALRPFVDQHIVVEHDDPCIAESINAAQLDLLVNLDPKISPELLQRIDTPCIVNFLTGNFPLPHPAIGFTGYPVRMVGYHTEGGRFVCDATQRPYSSDRVYQLPFLYDRRGMSASDIPPWRERENLMFVHGSLYKVASPSYLTLVYGLMVEDPGLQFAFMGRSRGRDLDVILGLARDHGLEDRVRYLGYYDSTRDEHGRIRDANWDVCMSMLKRARLVPNPFPLGGGSSRFECYVLGVACAVMDVGPYAYCNVDCLVAEGGMAKGIAEYEAICRRSLYDEAFFNGLASNQIMTANAVSDNRRWWRSVLAAYDDWRSNSASERRTVRGT